MQCFAHLVSQCIARQGAQCDSTSTERCKRCLYLTSVGFSYCTDLICRVIANYMMWRVVLRFAFSLTEDFKQVYYKYQKTVRGSTGKQDRWQDCLGSVDGSFGMPFGLMFVDKTFTGRSKESVRHVTNTS